jgi:hypothetical protein
MDESLIFVQEHCSFEVTSIHKLKISNIPVVGKRVKTKLKDLTKFHRRKLGITL